MKRTGGPIFWAVVLSAAYGAVECVWLGLRG